ncbi:hypothetical protein CBM2633_B60050 [Cupriavidus taiwanensis]|nr:hypothetical protein CBM2633_B60050 [Cupriavidus taiwanensis]
MNHKVRIISLLALPAEWGNYRSANKRRRQEAMTARGPYRRQQQGSRCGYMHHLQTAHATPAAATRRDGGPEPARAGCPVPPFRSPP